jgi:cell division septal protein FtsQ
MPIRRSTSHRRSNTLRRKSSHHLLEVKMRTDTARRQKSRKFFGIFFKVACILALLGATYFGGALLLDKFFFKNPDYNIQKIQASLDDVLTLPELQSAIGLHEGMNIFNFHLATAEKILNDLPEVKKAHIERVLPNTIQVTLERRIPILRLAASPEDAFVPGQSFMIDEDGIVISPAKLNAALLELPTIEGVSLADIHLGQTLQDEKRPFILALWKALNNSGNTLITIRSIDFSRGYWAVVTDINKTQYTFGPEHLSAQLERLQKLLSYCQENNRQLETVNLIVEHNTPVTFRPNTEAASLAAAKTVH